MAELRRIHATASRRQFKYIRPENVPDRIPRIPLEERKPEKEKSTKNDHSWETPVLDFQAGNQEKEKIEKKEEKTAKEEEKKTKSSEEVKKDTKDVQSERTRERKEETKEKPSRERKEETKEKPSRERKEETKEKPSKDVSLISRPKSHRKREVKEPTMTKIAFADPDGGFRMSERLNYMPHVILIICLLSGTVFMLSSVGSSHWMEAEVNSFTVYYGLFERCVTDPVTDVTVCETFDWPGWLYGTSQEKMKGIKTMAIVSIFFACVSILGALLLLLTPSCRFCHGWCRKSAVMVADICLWLTVISAAVSSLLFVTGVDNVQAYPDSTVLWPPVLYCSGWSLCLLSRLVIAACCDVHKQGEDSTVPFH